MFQSHDYASMLVLSPIVDVMASQCPLLSVHVLKILKGIAVDIDGQPHKISKSYQYRSILSAVGRLLRFADNIYRNQSIVLGPTPWKVPGLIPKSLVKLLLESRRGESVPWQVLFCKSWFCIKLCAQIFNI